LQIYPSDRYLAAFLSYFKFLNKIRSSILSRESRIRRVLPLFGFTITYSKRGENARPQSLLYEECCISYNVIAMKYITIIFFNRETTLCFSLAKIFVAHGEHISVRLSGHPTIHEIPRGCPNRWTNLD
jgi:hypothetical protein